MSEIETLVKDLNETDYIMIEIEPHWNPKYRETKGISFQTKKECDIVRKHIINALKELGEIK